MDKLIFGMSQVKFCGLEIGWFDEQGVPCGYRRYPGGHLRRPGKGRPCGDNHEQSGKEGLYGQPD